MGQWDWADEYVTEMAVSADAGARGYGILIGSREVRGMFLVGRTTGIAGHLLSNIGKCSQASCVLLPAWKLGLRTVVITLILSATQLR